MTRYAFALVALLLAVPAQAEDVVFSKHLKQFIAKGDDLYVATVTKLIIGDSAMTLERKGVEAIIIPYDAISGMTYDRRRRGSGLRLRGMPDKVQHVLTVQFKAGQTGEYVELEMGKDAAPRIVATLEAKSGTAIEKVAQ